ncbi:hypothetical protein NADFUDRAFT_47159 [Nadsonia fulvescens var. elongata DSM 6958]|uniref:Thioredoxin domain-containing protein n=1 Tax=Nadsonia fulvescens var. elongata DSM 6958 TaxID=857566 RepID=A0A1E3PGE3_9ASCO|nr:hypothetical protein NADFUDRAFT_47159 [Nadsonia fulvescens var. elongata DSM 6958]
MQLKSLLSWTTVALSVSVSFGQPVPNAESGDVALSGTNESGAATKVHMVKLNKKNYDSLTSKGTWFIKFFSPYCSHCITLAPAWEKTFEIIGETAAESDFYMAEIDCVSNGDLCAKAKITSYPTMQIYKDGKFVQEYDKFGSRKPEAFVKFIKTKLERMGEVDNTNGKTGTPVSRSGTSNWPKDLEGKSKEIDSKFYAQYISSSYDPWLIQISSLTYCKDCKGDASTWEEVGKLSKDKIRLGHINCDLNKKLCLDLLNIDGDHSSSNDLDIESQLQEPIYKLLIGKKYVIEYEEDSDSTKLYSFISNAMENLELKTLEVEDLEKKVTDLAKNDISISKKIPFIYIYEDGKPTPEQMQALSEFSIRMIGNAAVYKMKLTDAIKSNFNLEKAPGYSSDLPTLIALDGKYFDIYPNKFDEFNLGRADNLISWAKKNNYGHALIEVNENNFARIIEDNMLSNGKYIALAVLDSKDEANFDAYRKELQMAATLYRILSKTGALEGSASQEFQQNSDLESKYPGVQFVWVDADKHEKLLKSRFGIDLAEFKEFQANEKLTKPNVTTSKLIIIDKESFINNSKKLEIGYWDKNLDQEYIKINRKTLLEDIPQIINSHGKSAVALSGKFEFSSILPTILKVFALLSVVYIVIKKFKRRGANGLGGMFRKDSSRSRGLGLLDGKAE